MSHKINISSAKVLVIDDEPEITEIVETFLTEAGYYVMVENQPFRAIEKATAFNPDVILLDIMMPGMDGYDVCEALKKVPRLAGTPIIFLTGKDRNDDMGRSFKSGGDMFIKKPFSCERLLEILNIVLLSTGRH
ncbi:MAG TPA: response regulator [candidate division Zixibacteria bacterium]|nr:response regulator [candidate division Zixibacteria bacterium]MDD4918019.1 response regulator [candidate division Zixibacteria bacterium]MDM7974114.1 response regulator [candidate division Zixibacteria bacterium]HOD66877.1 response regulator [candidate division Zixibacteria bacterium]HPC12051.1 response regulator [candidate division Zixibacteria bacterium]